MKSGSRVGLAGALALGLAAWTVGDESRLDETTRAAITEAVQEEDYAGATYARVVREHDGARPFSSARRAGEGRSGLLEALLADRGLGLPENRWSADDVPSYDSLAHACMAAVGLEVRRVALYDRMLASPSLPDDVRRVFSENRRAALHDHKPAFEACAGWVQGRGEGQRVGRRGDWGCGHHGCGHHGCGHHGCGHRGCVGCGHH
jgi:hypothetical protein